MLKVDNLHIRAGDFTVKDVSFMIESGKCHILLGPTGSGKTLILETVAGLRPAQKGKVIAYGQDITNILPERREISYLPQDLGLFPNMTVKENIAYSLRMKGLGKKERFKEILPIAEALKIENILERRIFFLSGGERQRVALARALASNNKIMLLDEPLSSLNITLRRDIWRLIKYLQNEHELTLLMVTHDLEEALFLGDSISLINEGEFLQTGNKKEVFHTPLSVAAAKIVGIENYFAATVEEVKKGCCKVYSPELLSYFSIEGRHYNKCNGEKVICGIRGADILVINEDTAGQFNILDCIVQDIWDKENNAVLSLALLKNPRFELLVELFRDRNLKYCQGQKLRIKLPEDAIIILN